MNAITMKGSAAEIRWGYHRAADLGAWTVTAGQLSARIVLADAFRLTQSPLTFAIIRPNRIRWIYTLVDVCIADGTLTATLESPKES